MPPLCDWKVTDKDFGRSQKSGVTSIKVGPLRNNFTTTAGFGADPSSRQVTSQWSDGSDGAAAGVGVESFDPDVDISYFLESATLVMSAVKQEDTTRAMGTAQRSPVTGEVILDRDDLWPAFDVVDLFNRQYINGSLRQIVEDNYLFLPVPLPHRTWVYHALFEDRQVGKTGNPEHSMVMEALNTPGIDIDVSAGRWSPIMCYCPIVLALSITGDLTVMLAGIFLVLALQFLGAQMNQPAYYSYLRPATLPLRVGYAAILGIQISAFSALAIFVVVVAYLVMLGDIFCGDFPQWYYYGLNCRYEIVKALPERVFICKRIGGVITEDLMGMRPKVAEALTCVGNWHQDFYLIADIGGILAELRPIRIADALAIYQELCAAPRPLTFTSIGAFTFSCPTMAAFEATTTVALSDEVDRFQQNLDPDSLLYLFKNPTEKDTRKKSEDRALEELEYAPGVRSRWKDSPPNSPPIIPNAVFETDL
mmetsp:Transcript_15778/g.34505  ORF Transcript_15778/g.34505 Transcript_15778/m.34505 type:complete len:479 (+) Transcript_15778:164-1600(+)